MSGESTPHYRLGSEDHTQTCAVAAACSRHTTFAYNKIFHVVFKDSTLCHKYIALKIVHLITTTRKMRHDIHCARCAVKS